MQLFTRLVYLDRKFGKFSSTITQQSLMEMILNLRVLMMSQVTFQFTKFKLWCGYHCLMEMLMFMLRDYFEDYLRMMGCH